MIELSNSEGADMSLFASLDRIQHPARGRRGGLDGKTGSLQLSNGTYLRAKGEQVIPGDEKLTVLTPGGAGFGNPFNRNHEHIEQDLRDGLISIEDAESHYAVVLDEQGRIDSNATNQRRRDLAEVVTDD